MVLKNKILWGVLGVVVIVCFLQGKSFSLTHPLSGVLINNASESSLISQTNQAYAASLQQNTQQQQTFSSFNKTTNAEANQLIALNSKKNIQQETFSNSDLPVSNKFTSLNTISTSAAATITSSASSGNWSDPTSWTGGVVPGANDDVVIAAGTTILVDANTTCQSITIESGGILQIANSITLTLTGDWTNSGSFDAGTSGIVEFTGSTSSTISGTTAFEELIISKDNLSIPITITDDVTVSSGGNLTLTGGLIQVNSGASLNLDYSNQLTIPATAGFEVSGGTLETGNFSITNEGLIRVNSGIASFGTVSGNSVHTQVDGAFHVIDGTVNIAGRLENTAGGTLPPDIPSGINISGGTVNLATEGNGLSNTGSLQVSTQGAFNFTGGTIVFQNASTASTAIDMGLSDGTGNGSKTITNGIFQFGNGSTTSLSEFVIDSEIPIPNIEVYDNMDLALASPLTISNELVLGTNTQIDLNANTLRMKIVPSFGSIDIPLSDGSGNAMPLSVEITSGSYASDASITVSSVEGKPGSNANTSNYLNRYWTLDINGITGLEYNILADYPQSDVIGTESAITMGVYTGSLPWIKGAINTSTNEISATGLNTSSILFSGITAAPPTIVISNNDPTAICEGSSVNLTTTAAGDPTLNYAWTSTPAGFTASTADISVTPNTTTNYKVTVTDGNGFTASDAIDVVINPTPSVNQPANQIVCNSDATAAVNFSGTASSYNWTNDNTTIGLAASGSGNIASFTATNTTNAPIVANIEVTPVYSNAGVNCSGTPKSLTITVNPTPSVATPGDLSYCMGEVTPEITLTGSPSNVLFNITGGNTIGLTDRTGVTEIPSFTALPGNATITIIPVANGCSGSPINFTIDVTPLPNIQIPISSQTICSGESTLINLTSNAPSASFSWTVIDSGTISGATNGTGNTITQALVNSGPTTSAVTYEITVEANGCPGAKQNFEVTVYPEVTANITGNTSLCEGAPEPSITFTANGGTPPYTFTYTINGGANKQLTTSTGNSASLNVPSHTSGTYTYQLTNVKDNAICEFPQSSSATINIISSPVLTSTLSPPGICSNDEFSYTPESDVPGTTFSWHRPAVTGISNPAGSGTDNPEEYLENTTDSPIAVSYTYTLTTPEGCINTQEITVMVTPVPHLTSTTSGLTVCSGAAFSYTPTSDVGGTNFPWTRAAVSGISNPAASGAGNPSETLINTSGSPVGVTYVYTLESNNCENPVTYSVPVVVMPAPNVTASASEYTICPGESIDLFSSSDIGGGTMPTTLLSESFNSASSGSTSGPNGWTTDYNDNNARWTVRNNNYYYNTPGPGGVTFSSNDNSRFYLANLNDGSGWGINSRLISPSINTTGYTDLELRLWHYYRSGGNSDHAEIQISTDGSSWNTIEEFYSTQGSSTNFTQYTYDLSGYVGQPSLYIRFRYRGRDRDYFWAIDNISITGTPASVADVQWTSNTSSWTSTEINPTNISPTETTSYTVTYTDPDTGCDGSATTTIVVRDLPDISVDADYCSTPGDIILTASGASNYLWSTGETSNSIVVDVAGNFFVTGTDSYGCSATASYNTANELVVNGNFEAGNTGFTSGYGFRNPWITPPNYATNSSNSALWDENYYGIGENGRYYHSNFWGRDHSSGTGNYMIVNGNTSAGTPIWEQQVVVQPNTDYYFSAWAISLNRAGNYAVLQFEVDGVLVGTQARLPAGDNNDSNNNWVRFYSDPKWNSGSTSGLITIRIRNVEPAAGGNDFGLDDISFGTLDPSPAQIAPSANTSELCSGEALELYANTTGGKSPISFSWVGPNGFSSVEENPVISEADETYSGTYTLTVTDGYGCAISPESISVTIFPPPTVDAGADQEICSATPVISLSGSVGGAATSGIWNGMGGGSFDDNTQLSTLYTPSQAEISAGQAILVLKTEDPSGPCLPITDTVIVTINPSPELTIHLTHPSCNGESTGSASVSVSSGEPPFSFLWSDGQTTSSATNLAAGSYSITITDNNGCSSNTSIEIIDPPLLVIDLPSFTSPSCYGGNDGTATIHVNGGSPPYSYLWDANAGNQTSQTATGLNAGIYMYTVTDANGCNLTTDFVQVIDSPPPVFDCSSLSNIVTNADNGETFASNISTLYPASIDLSCQALSWDMHYKGSIINSGDHSDFPNQYTFQVDTTTINFVATNFAGEQLTCSYDVIVIPNDPPEIACSSPAPISVTPNNCSATLSISLPTVISGTAISWSWIMEGATTDSGTGSIPSPYTFYTGETTIRWTATNNAGSDECTQVITVTDTEPPIITPPDPYEGCVESLFLAQYNGTTNLTYNPMYPDADYHLFEAGNTSLDLDMPNDYDDNCCTAADSYTINWRIDFDGSEPSISGTGQPSDYGSDMPLWGNGVTYQNRVHTISYWVVDCHGNTSLEYSTTITITPRPNLIKLNE